jgi:hypothetical protein
MPRIAARPSIVRLLISLLVMSATAHASQAVLGKRFLVEDPLPGIDPSQRSIVVVGKESRGGHLVGGDPTVNGAGVRITTNGGALVTQSETYPMPAAGWTRIPKSQSDPLVGYRYVDPGKWGPVRSAIITAKGHTFLLQIVLSGAGGPGPQPHIDIVPPGPGADAVATFTITDGETYCVAFGGLAGGQVFNSAFPPPQDRRFQVISTASEPTHAIGCTAPTPNIVVILTDDQRYDTVGTTHSLTGTEPVMPIVTEALANQGVTFANTFATTPLCTPSRTSLLTGRYAHHTGVTVN